MKHRKKSDCVLAQPVTRRVLTHRPVTTSIRGSIITCNQMDNCFAEVAMEPSNQVPVQ